MPTGGGGNTSSGSSPQQTGAYATAGLNPSSIWSGYGGSGALLGQAPSNYGGVGYQLGMNQNLGQGTPQLSMFSGTPPAQSAYQGMGGGPRQQMQQPAVQGPAPYSMPDYSSSNPQLQGELTPSESNWNQFAAGQPYTPFAGQQGMFGPAQSVGAGGAPSQGAFGQPGTKSGNPMLSGASQGGFGAYQNPYGVASSAMGPYSNYTTQSPNFPTQPSMFSPWSSGSGGGTANTTTTPQYIAQNSITNQTY